MLGKSDPLLQCIHRAYCISEVKLLLSEYPIRFFKLILDLLACWLGT